MKDNRRRGVLGRPAWFRPSSSSNRENTNLKILLSLCERIMENMEKYMCEVYLTFSWEIKSRLILQALRFIIVVIFLYYRINFSFLLIEDINYLLNKIICMKFHNV